MVIVGVGGFSEPEVITKSIEIFRHAQGAEFCRYYFLMGWDWVTFGQPHIPARFMAADSHHVLFMRVVSV